MTIRFQRHTFHGGELDPLLRGRGDAPVYSSGLDKARNVLCSSLGDVRQRPGLRHIAATVAVAAADVTAGTPAAAFEDDFDRSNENLEADANWTRTGGSAGDAAIVSNEVVVSSGSGGVYFCPDQSEDNQYAEVTRAHSASSTGQELIIRATSDAVQYIGLRYGAAPSGLCAMSDPHLTDVVVDDSNPFETTDPFMTAGFYHHLSDNLALGTGWYLTAMIRNTETTTAAVPVVIGFADAPVPAGGERLRLEAFNDEIRVYVDGVRIITRRWGFAGSDNDTFVADNIGDVVNTTGYNDVIVFGDGANLTPESYGTRQGFVAAGGMTLDDFEAGEHDEDIDAELRTRLIPFPTEDQDYLIELDADSMVPRPSPPVQDSTLIQFTNGLWEADELRDVRWSQAFDTMILTHGNHEPQRLLRGAGSGYNNFSLKVLSFFISYVSNQVPNVPFHAFQGAGVQLTPSDSDGGALGSAPSATDIIRLTVDEDHFFSGHYHGVQLRYRGARFTITSVLASNEVIGIVEEDFDAFASDPEWDEQAWSYARGWPKHSAFFDQRLVFAGTDAVPDGIWFSKIGDFFNFDLGTAEDSDAIWTTLGVDKSPVIRGMIGLDDLLFTTSTGAMSTGSTITPADLSLRRQHSIGAADLIPHETDGAVVYVTAAGAVNEMVYSDNVQAYGSEPISTLANHLLGTVVETAASYATFGVPDRHIFLLQEDGTLLVGHSNRNEKVIGWQLWSVGDWGAIYAIAELRDKIYVVARPFVQDNERYLAAFDADYTLDLAVTQALVIDGVIPLEWPASAGGFIHVRSGGIWAVSVQDNGDGIITVGGSLADVEAGYGYAWQAKSLPLDVIDGEKVRSERSTRIVRAIPFLINTTEFAINGTDANLSAATSGATERRLLGWSREGQVDFTQGDHPGWFQMVALELEISDG